MLNVHGMQHKTQDWIPFLCGCTHASNLWDVFWYKSTKIKTKNKLVPSFAQ